MKYKIEIWQWHKLVEIYKSGNIKEILKWYKENWQDIYNIGDCTFYVYENDRKLTFSEEYKLGFGD